MSPQRVERPDITFIPASTDLDKIRFFGTLMPNLLLLMKAPHRWVGFQVQRRLTPRRDLAGFIQAGVDDATRAGDLMLFVHRWRTVTFDPVGFARARTFLEQLTRMLHRAGFTAEPLDPLSPTINLPKLAAAHGVGELSPFGLLVHPLFGPRLIITGMRTDYPLALTPRFTGSACSDCMTCVTVCPQAPSVTGQIDLGQCHACAKCLVDCPTGKSRRAQKLLAASLSK